MDKKIEYLILGNGVAAINACMAIRKISQTGTVTIISTEKYPAYSAALITYLVAGEKDEKDLILYPMDWYKQNNIEIILGERVVKVEPASKRVTLSDRKKLFYEKLLIATGASSLLPKIPGIDQLPVFSLRALDDAKRIIRALTPKVKNVVVIGAGLVGLKTAEALKKRGLNVALIEQFDQVLPRNLDRQGAEIVQSWLQREGVVVKLGQTVKEIQSDNVVLDSGEKIPCEMVIVAAGVRPNLDFLEGSGITVKQGILVNDRCETNMKDVYAAGDVAKPTDLISGETGVNAIWPAASKMGKVAGSNTAGKAARFEGGLPMNSMNLFGLTAISFGVVKEEKGDEKIVGDLNPAEGIYQKVVLRNNRIVGAVLIGKNRNAGVLLGLLKNGVDVSPFKDSLLKKTFNYAKVLSLRS
ncbi:MAG: FAD-dependent oxidoreductase [Actinomycetota bacterium]